jgi:hypothetical protein
MTQAQLGNTVRIHDAGKPEVALILWRKGQKTEDVSVRSANGSCADRRRQARFHLERQQ